MQPDEPLERWRVGRAAYEHFGDKALTVPWKQRAGSL